jgi:hypothetical protein
MKNLNPKEIEVTVKDSDGKTIREPFNPNGPQSDGSEWHIPRPLIPEGHEHYFKLNSGKRWAECSCGFGGYVYPANAIWKDGHIYKRSTGEKVI